ncbi:alpha/beta hydrolase [Fictibacillus nanhaiensis]|uniref:alpha/beta fold hydrolase n=1 Tax=Fictibacillus nanhaiensis TaxID=742169 RepID=UPI001C964ABF|nr:alpha/beta hydrolase [Fictibacillus nanhaiensis]MBY6036586.1 alpha/beta hydrolase [Fictibacillus nanhaiensis]
MPHLERDGASLFYSVQGEGLPIVFIHPPLLTSENFKYQVDELSKQYQVITFDIRGHGKSSYSCTPLTYSIIAQDIKSLLDHLQIPKAFLCGYSTGGSIVLEFLLTYGDRAFGGIVISGMSEVFGVLKDKVFLGYSLAKQKAIPLLALSVCKSNSNNDDMYQLLLQAAMKGNAKNIEQYYGYSFDYNCTDQLKKIHLPVLLVYGRKDRQFHAYAKILHKKLPHNELKFIENVKHQIPTKAAAELNVEMVRFMGKQKDYTP